MKSTVEPLVKETEYKKSEDGEEENRRSGSDDDNTDTVDLSLFDNDDKCMIDSDYHIMEGCAQKSPRTNDRLFELGNID